mmetsp:Transcript_36189/g.107477  ORF Transcript_36189/g.107477 Transcript_36189/m.107477 type:complete len:205 (-) Transcript_36189:96-710(-)
MPPWREPGMTPAVGGVRGVRNPPAGEVRGDTAPTGPLMLLGTWPRERSSAPGAELSGGRPICLEAQRELDGGAPLPEPRPCTSLRTPTLTKGMVGSSAAAPHAYLKAFLYWVGEACCPRLGESCISPSVKHSSAPPVQVTRSPMSSQGRCTSAKFSVRPFSKSSSLLAVTMPMVMTSSAQRPTSCGMPHVVYAAGPSAAVCMYA